MDTVKLPRRTAAQPEGGESGFALAFDALQAGHALRLHLTGTARHAADAAIALHDAEELLGVLDDWCGAALDWRWAPQAGRQATDAQLALRCGEGWARLLCTWDWLRALPAPMAALAGRLRWPPVPAVVQAGLLRLATEELALLEPGGLLLLPASMQSPWQGSLRGVDEAPDVGIALEIGDPAAPQLRRRPAAPLAAGGGEVLCEVRLYAPPTLAGDHLAGWHETGLDLGAFGGRAALWRCADSASPALCLAGGRLLPWGDGWALRLESVET